MEILKAIFLGILQGLTEFLPVSSSGHLLLFQNVLNVDFDNGTVFFELMLHVGTLVPLFVIFFKDILGLFKKGNKTILYLIIASIPAVIVMALFKDVVGAINGTKFVCFMFLITAIILYFTEYFAKRISVEKEFTWKSALTMGVLQSVAVIPGISRSGSTISGGILSGCKKEEVAKFSFFMGMIVIGGSAFLQLLDFKSVQNLDFTPIIAGTIAAAISGFFAIKLFLKVIAKSNYKWFSLYLVVLFAITFIDGYIVSFI